MFRRRWHTCLGHMLIEIYRLVMNRLTWERLRILGASKIMSLAALMPFFGFVIILNQHTLELVNWLGTTLEVLDQSTNEYPSFTLFLLYYGAVLLGIGKLFFNVSCPPEITRYMNREDYIEKKERLKTELEYTTLREIVKSYGVPYKTEAEKIENSDERNNQLDSTGEGYRTLLGLQWDYLDHSNQAGRKWVTGFFFSGLVIFSTPSLVTLWKVTRLGTVKLLSHFF